MVAAAIVISESGFWLLLASGLWLRYRAGRKTVGMVLLALTPVVDLFLLVVATVDLSRGATAGAPHAFAAVYVGVSIAFGPRILAWADAHFAHRFAGGPAPARPPKGGFEHARRERAGWYRHALAWAVGVFLLLAGVAVTGDADRTEALANMAGTWTLILAIDFAWSFSYTLWPRASHAGR